MVGKKEEEMCGKKNNRRKLWCHPIRKLNRLSWRYSKRIRKYQRRILWFGNSNGISFFLKAWKKKFWNTKKAHEIFKNFVNFVFEPLEFFLNEKKKKLLESFCSNKTIPRGKRKGSFKISFCFIFLLLCFNYLMKFQHNIFVVVNNRQKKYN